MSYVQKNSKNGCSRCSKLLSTWDKGKSLDHGLMDDRETRSPTPLCVNCAYYFASLYIKEKENDLINPCQSDAERGVDPSHCSGVLIQKFVKNGG